MKQIIYFLATTITILSFQSCNGDKDAKDAADSVNQVKERTPNVMATGTLEVNLSDAEFATKVAVEGMSEVELGKIALHSTNNVKLKDFARMMVKDYDKSNQELASIALKKNISLPLILDHENQKKSHELNEIADGDFDRVYIKTMVDKHKSLLKVMQKEAKDGKDAALRTFAAKTAAIVQSHLDIISKIQESPK
ncbi:putative membrane protein [Pedobacter cryoconitis]|uniref:DUF4142 domain-containing protein n=1 Tax=Pedobacter cryoconitis TaxID=188932 RepID=UPI00160D406D|nr:DUF4142 domain-containing protein [Pedobacter cryoconitis]MBB6271293.1 putative membrane protein [Pedobacter cryoconitis]